MTKALSDSRMKCPRYREVVELGYLPIASMAERALSEMVTTAERTIVRKGPYLRGPRWMIALRTSAALGASACITPEECVTFLLSVRATP